MRLKNVLATVLLLLATLLLAFPFMWLVAGSFKSNAELFRPLDILPASLSPTFYRELLAGGWLPFPAQYASTFLIVLGQTCLALLASSAAGFVFAHYTFRGRQLLYALGLSVIFVPRQILIVPLLEWLIPLGLTDSRWGVILPGSVSGLGLLFFTEMARRLPAELFEAARLEGASEVKLYTYIALPLLRPALVTFGFIHALLAAHETLLPLIVLSTPEKLTVTVGLGSLFGSYGRIPYAVVLAGFVLSASPFVLAFALVGRQLRSVLRDLLNS